MAITDRQQITLGILDDLFHCLIEYLIEPSDCLKHVPCIESPKVIRLNKELVEI